MQTNCEENRINIDLLETINLVEFRISFTTERSFDIVKVIKNSQTSNIRVLKNLY